MSLHRAGYGVHACLKHALLTAPRKLAAVVGYRICSFLAANLMRVGVLAPKASRTTSNSLEAQWLIGGRVLRVHRRDLRAALLYEAPVAHSCLEPDC